ncbi:MAG: MazG family protein [Puniceicoccaceae bacterium]|nr:MAG: MazG family protein [Puniceicoccaceae bacterium]
MSALDDLKETVARLRGPGGCPWDREQDHRSLRICLIEECCELLDTIDRLDLEHMREELGDVLLQVVFHANLAEEAGHFTLDDVAAEINRKLIRRHPHVFGEAALSTSAEVLQQWDRIKAEEKEGKGAEGPAPLFKELPPTLPALLHAWELVKQAQKKGLPLPQGQGLEEVEAVAAGLSAETAGRELFRLAAACRLAGIEPETALREQTARVKAALESGQASETGR